MDFKEKEQSEDSQEEDLFKASFKKFKLSKNPKKGLFAQKKKTNGIILESDGQIDGIDVREILLDPTTGSCTDDQESGAEWDKLLQKRCLDTGLMDQMATKQAAEGLGLAHPSKWKVFDLKFPKGLILIRNPFTPEGQRYWISRSVLDFPFQARHITNIDNLENKEGKTIKDKLDREEFFKQLRWTTFGFHHNWDTKVYSEDNKCEFPPDLAKLTKFMADVLGFPDFKAEASIANYYHLNSTLSGHVDRSEADQNAPLFSLSFGQSAVFLIGGKTKAIKPQAITLQSGDVAVMSGESRLAFHGVPLIFKAEDVSAWALTATDISPDCQSSIKRPKLDDINPYSDSLNVEWSSFLSSYVCKSRINLNVRQVLFPGQEKLDESQTIFDNK